MKIFKTLSKELLDFGISHQNMAIICDALFYFVRSREYRCGRTSFSEVIRYLAAMEFVEYSAGLRNRFLQALQTEGSIYRHYCRQDHITWPEYEKHFESAIEIYTRVFEASIPQKKITYILNAISYSMEFCLRSLRADFYKQLSNDKKTLRRLITYFELVKGWCDRFGRLDLPSITGKNNQQIFQNIMINYPLLEYAMVVSSVSKYGKNESGHLKAHFHNAVKIIKKLQINESFNKTHYKTLITVARNLNRLFDFGHNMNNELNAELLLLIKEPIKQFLYITKWMNSSKQKQNKRKWQKLNDIVRRNNATIA